MRNRFFAIILTVLLVVALATMFIHSFFLQNERLSLIDEQIRDTAATLVDSEISELRMVNFQRVDEIISEELGESRIGKFFIIRNGNGEIIFESTSAKVLPIVDIPQAPQLFTLREKGQFIRVLNLKLPRIPDRILQVGIVLDEGIYSPNYLSQSGLFISLILISIGLSVAWFLTSTLLRPIQSLRDFVIDVAKREAGPSELPRVPEKLHSYGHKQKKDEFQELLTCLDAMIEKINKGNRFFRYWAYQMAHEIKTPLSIMKIVIEQCPSQDPSTIHSLHVIGLETERISETINSFLGWAEVENVHRPQNLFANKLSKKTQEIVQRLSVKCPGRPVLNIEKDFYVIANIQHLEQVMMNLIQNALIYSPDNSPVYITIEEPTMVIKDLGPGIDPEVLKRIGEPFNRGATLKNKDKGNGLGMAWVYSLCRLYDWELKIHTGSTGTMIVIKFPMVD